MVDEDFWNAVRTNERQSGKSQKSGVLNIALLFGTAAIALSLILTPMLAGTSSKPRLAFKPDEFDNITTGSIRSDAPGAKRYTIRRSVLQKTPGSVCIISGDEAGGNC